MAKPRISILDRRFKYQDSANTDVGRHLREHQRKQRLAEKRGARDATTAVVRQLTKRSAS